jgi:hypothetical protein
MSLIYDVGILALDIIFRICHYTEKDDYNIRFNKGLNLVKINRLNGGPLICVLNFL